MKYIDPIKLQRSHFKLTYLLILGMGFTSLFTSALFSDDDDENPPVAHIYIQLDDLELKEEVRVPVMIETFSSLSMISLSLEYHTHGLRFIRPELSPELQQLMAQHPESESEFRWFTSCEHEDPIFGCEGDDDHEEEDDPPSPDEPEEIEEQAWLQVSIVLDFEARPEFSLEANNTVPLIYLVFESGTDIDEAELEFEFSDHENADYQGNFFESDGESFHFNAARPTNTSFDSTNLFDNPEQPDSTGGVVRVLKVLGDIGLFSRGDANLDENIDLSDPVSILNHMFSADGALACPEAADANADQRLDISDAFVVLVHLFVDSERWSPSMVYRSDFSGAHSTLSPGCY